MFCLFFFLTKVLTVFAGEVGAKKGSRGVDCTTSNITCLFAHYVKSYILIITKLIAILAFTTGITEIPLLKPVLCMVERIRK